MIDGWQLAIPWMVATLVWLWSGRTTVRFYRFANGDLPLASALARVNGIRALESLFISIVLFWLEAGALGTVVCYILAVASIGAAFEVKRSGRFMHERATKVREGISGHA